MKGLELAKRLYEERARKLFENELPDLIPQMAVGLVGEGSECFGFDDEISRDHDWGPAFCIWLPQEVLAANSGRLDSVLAELPRQFEGFEVRMTDPRLRMGRVGPLPLELFYQRFLNVPRAPENLMEWRRIPEQYLAVATNGEVFQDNLGTFSAIREKLLAFYPEDLRLKKIAARIMAASQAGQYNLPRMLRRCDFVACDICRARFIEAVLSTVFLINRKYVPFYKWAFRAVKQLPLMGMSIAEKLEHLVSLPLMETMPEAVAEPVEGICQEIADHLQSEGLLDSNDPWLFAQGPVVQAHIENNVLRSMPPQLE